MANYRGQRQGAGGSDHYPIYFRTRIAGAGDIVDLISDSDHEKFLGFEDDSSANGTRIDVEPYKPGRSQWILRQAAGGGQFDFNFVNVATGKCMDVYHGIYSVAGDPLDEYDCLGIPSQVFTLYYWPGEPGTWEIVNKSTGLYVDTQGINPRYLALWDTAVATAPNEHFLPHFF
ncbi:RICIN domain-containing protein [Streptomyces sp. NPDC005122]